MRASTATLVGALTALAIGCGTNGDDDEGRADAEQETSTATDPGPAPDTGPRTDAADTHPGCEDGELCDDGDPCTKDSLCVDGVCQWGSAVTCPSPGPCKTGGCDPTSGCTKTFVDPDGTPCDAACHGSATCQDGVCVPDPETLVACPAPDLPCVHAMACNPETGACDLTILAAAGTPCDMDSDVCSLETCDALGLCAATGDLELCESEAATTPCYSWSCEKTLGCQPGAFLDDLACDDEDGCSENDVCSADAMACVGAPVPTDDGNPCTADSCVDGEVIHAPDDGVACGEPGICEVALCSGGACNSGFAEDGSSCEAGKICSGGSCVLTACPGDCGSCELCDIATATCVATVDGTSCGTEKICVAGACKPATCDPPCGACQVCEPITQTCPPAPDGVECPDDGDPCTEDGCLLGLCDHEMKANGTSCGEDAQCQEGACLSAGACPVWTAGLPAESTINNTPAIFRLGEQIHVAGGSPLTQHLVYDLASGGWSTGTNVPPLGLAEAVGGATGGTAFAIHNVIDDQVRIYHSGTKTWTLGPARPTDHGRAPAGAAMDGSFYVFGGANTAGEPGADSHRYDLAADLWIPLSPMPSATAFGASAVLEGAIVVAGGKTPDGVVATVLTYDVAKDAWGELPLMPTPRSGAVAGVANGVLYVVGGTDDAGPSGHVESYNPTSGEWTTCPTFDGGLAGHAGIGADGKILVFGGGASSHAVRIGVPQ